MVKENVSSMKASYNFSYVFIHLWIHPLINIRRTWWKKLYLTSYKTYAPRPSVTARFLIASRFSNRDCYSLRFLINRLKQAIRKICAKFSSVFLSYEMTQHKNLETAWLAKNRIEHKIWLIFICDTTPVRDSFGSYK